MMTRGIAFYALALAAAADTSPRARGEPRYALLNVEFDAAGRETLRYGRLDLASGKLLWTREVAGASCWAGPSGHYIEVSIRENDDTSTAVFVDPATGNERFRMEGSAWQRSVAGHPRILNYRKDALACLDPATGRAIWTHPGVHRSWELRDLPGGRIIVGGDEKTIHCLDASTGREIWKRAYDGNLLAAGGRFWSYGYDKTAITEVDAATGRDGLILQTGGGIRNVTSTEDRIVVMLDNRMNAYRSSDGAEAWSLDFVVVGRIGNVWDVGGHLVCLNDNYSLLQLLRPSDGRKVWETALDPGSSMSWTWTRDGLFLNMNRTVNKLTVIDAREGRIAWERPATDYDLMNGRAMAVVRGPGGLEMLDLRTGRTIWRAPAADEKSWVASLSRRVLYSAGRTLRCLDADGGRELWKLDLGGDPKQVSVSPLLR